MSGEGDYTGELIPDEKIAEGIQRNSLKHDLTLSKPMNPSSGKSDVFKRSVFI